MSRPIQVMLVEDEALLAILLQKNLQSLGYEVSGPYATGEEAVEEARKNRPDVVLMDIRLAGALDGIEAAEKIMAMHNTPIIFMTGYSDVETIARAQALNPAAYLVKPVSKEYIKSVIDTLFK